MPSISCRWHSSLSFRLLATYVCAWLVMAVLFIGVGSWALQDGGRWVDYGADRVAQKLATHIRYDAEGRPGILALDIHQHLQWVFDALPLDAGFRIMDGTGQTLSWSSAGTRDAWTRSGLTNLPPTAGLSATSLDGVAVHLATHPLSGMDGASYWLQVAVSERLAALRHDELGDTFAISITLAAILSIALLGLVLFLLLRRQLAPIQRASQEAQLIEPREPWRRLGTDSIPSEIYPLVHSFNQALDRLEKGFELQQHFLADAAHELKTPLALLKAHLETGNGDPSLMLRDIDHMSRQIQQLLMLTEVSELGSYQVEAMDVTLVIEDVLSFLGPIAARHQVDLVSVGKRTQPLRGDRSALFVLLKNLVENAIAVSPAGESVCLFINEGAILVLDQGPGIKPEYLTKLFQRFWRVPGSKHGGAGLGLAICLEVAKAHGWRLSVRNTEPGCQFALRF